MKSEKRIYHTYNQGRKIKNITTLAGLKQFSSVNKENTLSFSDLLAHNNFVFCHSAVGEISRFCRLCNNELPIAKVDECSNTVFLSLCRCPVDNPLKVTRERFLSVISAHEIDMVYEKYKKARMRNWTTAGIPVSSLEFKISKYGDEEGRRKYKMSCAKMDNTSVAYFMSRGFSETEATAMCKKRQTTFSLQKCIDTHGEIGGRKRWEERQALWQKTLNDKPHAELERINQQKIWRSGNVSKVSQKLFRELDLPGARWGNKQIDNAGEKLITLEELSKRCMVDYFYNNKIIEFFGDYWHAHPSAYSPHDAIFRRGCNTTASEIWASDAKRVNALKNLGYNVMIVWERDFIANPEKVIEKCKSFLNS